MSHFLVAVITPGDTKPEQVRSKVEELLAPYDENTEVAEYDADCHCIGQVARREAAEKTVEKFGTIEVAREQFDRDVRKPYVQQLKDAGKTDAEIADEMYPFNDDSYISTKWEEFIAPRLKFEQEYFDSHPMKDKPDPTCGFYTGERQDWWGDAKEGDRYDDGSGCGGTGKYKSTYNPKSRWDWWDFGGRWNGVITGKPEGSEDGFNFDPKYRQFENNMVKVSDMLAAQLALMETAKDTFTDESEQKKFYRKNSRMPFAIVTPDGEWHEKGKMGWWAVVTDKNDNWEDVALELLKQHSDGLMFGIDCHI